MQVLQRLDGLYIKGTYLVNQLECTISNVTISMAVEYGDPNYDRPASSVEECACPSSYTGQSQSATVPQPSISHPFSYPQSGLVIQTVLFNHTHVK